MTLVRIGGGIESAVFAGLAIMLLAVPLPLGTNRPLFVQTYVTAASALTACWIAASMAAGRPLPETLWRWRVPILMLALWAAWAAIQAMTVPGWLIELLSRTRYERVLEWQRLDIEAATLSYDAAASVRAFWQRLALLETFLLVLVGVQSWDRARRLAAVLVAGWLLQALLVLYGQVPGAGTPLRDLLSPWLREGEAIFGSFVNRNHAGGFLAMGLAAVFGFLLATLRRPPGAAGNPVARIAGFLLGPGGGLCLAGMLLMAALVSVGSRGAVVAFTAALLVLFVLALVSPERRSATGILAILLPMTLIVLVGANWIDLFDEFAVTGLLPGDRIVQWQLSLPMIRDHPFAGIGADAYRNVFEAYRDGSLPGVIYDHAHSDYLELVIEDGIVGFAFLAIAALHVLVAALARVARPMSSARAGLLFACIGAVLVVVVQMSVEFVLQIPVIVVHAVVMLALAAAVLGLPSRARGPSRVRNSRQPYDGDEVMAST